MRSIQELQVWIAENCQKKFSMRELAERVSMSPRTFDRVFTREVGMTPSQYVLRIRVEAAQRQMERTNRGLKQIAAACGLEV
jgi:transcriptional regulator GlxA family with amidase domain